jgi:hypothetical protein
MMLPSASFMEAIGLPTPGVPDGIETQPVDERITPAGGSTVTLTYDQANRHAMRL